MTLLTLMKDLHKQLIDAPLQSIADYRQASRSSGLYSLNYNGKCVYIGKSKSDLRNRLSIHCRKLQKSLINIDDVYFRIVVEDQYLSMATEQWLIDETRPLWNLSGFGSNAHGKGRANQKTSNWLLEYGR